MSNGGEAAAAAAAAKANLRRSWLGRAELFLERLVSPSSGGGWGGGNHTAAQAQSRRQQRRMDSLFTQAVRGLEHEGGKCQ